MKKIISVLLIFISTSSYSQKKINTKANSEYKKHFKGLYGKLTPEAYKTVIDSLQLHSEIELDKSKKVYVHFQQKGDNCIMYGQKESSIEFVLSNIERISKRVTQNNQTQRLLIFNQNSFFKEHLKKRIDWKLDTGFFKRNIFTEDTICQAFFVLKPNGEFYKFYGSDHFTLVKVLLENEEWLEGVILLGYISRIKSRK